MDQNDEKKPVKPDDLFAEFVKEKGDKSTDPNQKKPPVSPPQGTKPQPPSSNVSGPKKPEIGSPKIPSTDAEEFVKGEEKLLSKEDFAPPVEQDKKGPSLDELEDEAAEEENEELILLSGFLNDRFLISTAIEKGFKPFLLRSRQARTLCSVIFELYDSQREDVIIDKNTVKNELIYRNYFTAEMQEFYKKLIQTEPPQLAQMMAYIDILKMKTGKDKLREVRKMIEEYLGGYGLNKEKEIADFSGEIAHQLMALQKLQFHEVIMPMKYKMYELENEIRNRDNQVVIENMGFSIKPFSTLNRSISGLRKGFYYGLVGAPRRGKTNFSLQIASHVAAQNKIPVLFYSWEQTQRVLTLRILSKESLINPTILQTENVMENKKIKEKFMRGWRAAEAYMNYMFMIEGGQKDNFERIEAHAYNVMHEFETDDIAIFIDYLQKMPLEGHITDPQTRINSISSGLAELSLSLNTPIWAISSLDKEGCKLDEKESFTRPTMHNSTGSGDIEYDLDVALVFSKDWHDTAELLQQLREIARTKNIPEDRIPKIDIVNLNIDKNRDAPPGGSSIIQYLFFIEINKHIELGYKNPEEEHTYTKIQNIIRRLIKSRIIWDEYEELLEEFDLMDMEGGLQPGQNGK